MYRGVVVEGSGALWLSCIKNKHKVRNCKNNPGCCRDVRRVEIPFFLFSVVVGNGG